MQIKTFLRFIMITLHINMLDIKKYCIMFRDGSAVCGSTIVLLKTIEVVGIG